MTCWISSSLTSQGKVWRFQFTSSQFLHQVAKYAPSYHLNLSKRVCHHCSNELNLHRLTSPYSRCQNCVWCVAWLSEIHQIWSLALLASPTLSRCKSYHQRLKASIEGWTRCLRFQDSLLRLKEYRYLFLESAPNFQATYEQAISSC